MPMQKTSIMVIDTETIGLNREVYDVGIIVTDRKGKIIERYTRLVREIITDAKKMRGAFYTNRVYSHYIPMLDQNEITLAPWPTIGADIRDMVQRHNINLIAAYNLPFDLRVMKKTSQALGYGPILNSPFKLLDIWRFVCMAKLNTRLYKQLATERGWVSPAGNFKTGAEYACYRTMGLQRITYSIIRCRN